MKNLISKLQRVNRAWQCFNYHLCKYTFQNSILQCIFLFAPIILAKAYIRGLQKADIQVSRQEHYIISLFFLALILLAVLTLTIPAGIMAVIDDFYSKATSRTWYSRVCEYTAYALIIIIGIPIQGVISYSVINFMITKIEIMSYLL